MTTAEERAAVAREAVGAADYRTCGRCSYDTYGGDSDLQDHLLTRHGVQIGQPTAMQRTLADPLSRRLLTRQRRLRRSIEEERARLGASCGDMSPATINDTSLRLARMEVVVEELDYAMDAMAEGASLQGAVGKAVERLLNDAAPLGGMTMEVQRARFAGLAEVVRILQDELANR